ncbi:MAG: hypothetical protein K0S07_685 [Chlamydiales bacterium]|nr:hypothetical protein [Chlamydiales bacterium]
MEDKQYLVGIDLGTTNCALSYMEKGGPLHLFRIPQAGRLGLLEDRHLLPSICYLLSKEEVPRLPWEAPDSPYLLGTFAEELGSKVPTRLIRSAKSWLSYSLAARKEKILPMECVDADMRISPLKALSLYLNHLCQAWNAQMARKESSLRLEQQEIVITIPASFDEVARSLTVEAAKMAGFTSFSLLEEPQAAFYDWLACHEKQWDAFDHGDLILVCDVGGGTTDFSLIEVLKTDSLQFRRSFVGRHLLLGGDNMDQALAHLVEGRLKGSLKGDQWALLTQQVKQVKESLLSGEKSASIILQGSGSSVVRGMKRASLTKEEVEDFLKEGFFGLYPLKEALAVRQAMAVKGSGLPYEEEPSITKQLALFLSRTALKEGLKAPTHVLFNGAALKPPSFQERILHSLKMWFPESSPKALQSNSLDYAVARGAAYYAGSKLGVGVRVQGGSARTYYLKVASKLEGEEQEKALTLLIKGSEEGARFEPENLFSLSPNQPVSFSLYASEVRLHEKAGSLVEIDEEEMRLIAPIETILRYGKGSVEPISVKIVAELTAIGTLELSLHALKSQHIWRLEYQVRGQEFLKLAALPADALFDREKEAQLLVEAEQTIQSYFQRSFQKEKKSLLELLEGSLQQKRLEWPVTLIRKLWHIAFQLAPQRLLSSELESRWWNLIGFLLRPGYGYSLDEERMKELWRLLLADLKRPIKEEAALQRLIAIRRLAGGFNKGQQMQLLKALAADVLAVKKEQEKVLKALYVEKVRLIGSFELLDLPLKVSFAEYFLKKILGKKALPEEYWALGRLGSRQMAYASLAHLVPRQKVMEWISLLLPLEKSDSLCFIYEQLARKTAYRECNISDDLKDQLLASFAGLPQEAHFQKICSQESALSEKEREVLLADRLPCGLSIEQ